MWETTSPSAGTHELPSGIHLGQNDPNPFNPTTSIEYRLDRAGQVTLRVFDVQGRIVRTLVDAEKAAGAYVETFPAAGLPSGTYVYRLETPGGSRTRKMILAK